MSFTVKDVRKRLNDEGKWSFSLSGGGESEIQYFIIVVDNPLTTPLEIERVYGTFTTTNPNSGATYTNTIPNWLSPHPIAPFLCCIRKDAKRTNGDDGKPSNCTFLLEVEYGYTNASLSVNGNYISVKVSGVEQSIYTQRTRGASPQPIVNSVDDTDADGNVTYDLYPEPVEIQIYDEQIAITCEMPTIDGDTIAALRGCTNNGVVSMSIPQNGLTYTRSFALHTLLLKSLDYGTWLSRVNPQNVVWNADIILLWRQDTWDAVLPDKGFRWYDAITDELTNWKETPQYLDGDGYLLTAGSQIVTLPPAQRYVDAALGTFLSSL